MPRAGKGPAAPRGCWGQAAQGSFAYIILHALSTFQKFSQDVENVIWLGNHWIQEPGLWETASSHGAAQDPWILTSTLGLKPNLMHLFCPMPLETRTSPLLRVAISEGLVLAAHKSCISEICVGLPCCPGLATGVSEGACPPWHTPRNMTAPSQPLHGLGIHQEVWEPRSLAPPCVNWWHQVWGCRAQRVCPRALGKGWSRWSRIWLRSRVLGGQTAPPEQSLLLRALEHADCREQADLARLQREHRSAHTWDGAIPIKAPEQTTGQDSPRDCPHRGPAVSPVCPVGLSARTTPNAQARAEQGLAVREAPNRGLSPP